MTKGSSFEGEENNYGLAHYLNNQDLLKYVLKIVKRVRNVKKKEMFLLEYTLHESGYGC
jgi:hypothetical protein